MSANVTSEKNVDGTNLKRTEFDNQIPIPSYLLAMAVGDIKYQPLGKRVGVYTEPSMLN